MLQRPTGYPEGGTVTGELCLDFANTARWHASLHPIETLHSFEDFVRWSRSAGLLDRARAAVLLREARRHPTAARVALRRATLVREIVYRVVVALLRGERPRGTDLSTFNRAVRSALGHVRLTPLEGGLAWTWIREGRQLDSMLWPILDSAAELLTSDRRTRIGQCADDRGCGWLFVDTTKNRSRRWCDMGDCGNRAKARRHRHRRRSKMGKEDRANDHDRSQTHRGRC
jgi:predicted RNA-binding Zn ribbon-like protein